MHIFRSLILLKMVFYLLYLFYFYFMSFCLAVVRYPDCQFLTGVLS